MPQHKSVSEFNSNNNNSSYITRERKRKLTRKSVLKMLAVMEASSQNAGPSSSNTPSPTNEQSSVNAQDFLSSGRTGRRNALPDILGQHAAVTSSDLPSKLQALTTKDKSDNKNKEEASTSKG